MSSLDNEDQDPPSPFFVQLFYRNGGFPRPDEFAPNSRLPYISVYTWPSCTLHELAHELAASKPEALPYPSIGTRLCFQLICPDLRNVGTAYSASPRYAVKDLGSIVIGQQGPGPSESGSAGLGSSTREVSGMDKRTLGEARFVVGDYISCAILAPLADGSIASPAIARQEANAGSRDGRVGRAGAGFHTRENGFGRLSQHEGTGGRRGGNGSGGNLPMGEWRRGERLPNVPPSRPRGGGGGRGGGGRW